MTEQQLVTGGTRSRIKFLINDVFLYGIASALVPLISLITVPLLTHRLTASEYGAFELVISYVGVAAIIGGLGQDSAFARFYYDDDDVDRRKAVIKQAFLTQFIASIVVCLGIVVFGTHLFSKISSISHYQLVVICAALAVPAIVGFNFSRNVLKWTFFRKQYVVATMIYGVVILIGYYILIVIYNLGTMGAVAAQIIASLLAFAWGCWIIRHCGIGLRLKNFSFAVLRYGIPYVILGMLSLGFRALDKTIIANYGGLESAAVYAVGFKIATLILVIESTFNLAWGPVALAIHKSKDSVESYNMALSSLGWVSSSVFLFIAIFSDWIVAFVAPSKYAEAADVATIICTGFVMQSLAGVAAIGIELAKKPRLLILSWVVGVGLATVLMLQLAPTMGVIGVAIAVSIGFFVEAVIRIICAYRVYPIRLELKQGIAPLLLAISMTAVTNIDTQVNKLQLQVICAVAFAVAGAFVLRRNWASI